MNVTPQLFSARDAGPWEDILARLSALGYTGVEASDPSTRISWPSVRPSTVKA